MTFRGCPWSVYDKERCCGGRWRRPHAWEVMKKGAQIHSGPGDLLWGDTSGCPLWFLLFLLLIFVRIPNTVGYGKVGKDMFKIFLEFDFTGLGKFMEIELLSWISLRDRQWSWWLIGLLASSVQEQTLAGWLWGRFQRLNANWHAVLSWTATLRWFGESFIKYLFCNLWFKLHLNMNYDFSCSYVLFRQVLDFLPMQERYWSPHT